MNIILDICRYSVYDNMLTTEDAKIEKKIISRRSLPMEVGNEIRLKQLNNDYCIDMPLNQERK